MTVQVLYYVYTVYLTQMGKDDENVQQVPQFRSEKEKKKAAGLQFRLTRRHDLIPLLQNLCQTDPLMPSAVSRTTVMGKTVEFNVFRGSERGEITPEATTRTIGPSEVFVEISHAGLCGTDRLFRNKNTPLGHEGAGTVRDIGSAVESFHIGDRVGFGGVHKQCGHCDYCITGR